MVKKQNLSTDTRTVLVKKQETEGMVKTEPSKEAASRSAERKQEPPKDSREKQYICEAREV